MSNKSFKQITADLNKGLATFRSAQPETMAGFSAMAKAAMAPGVLSAIDKELMALAIGFHVKALLKLGASKAQLDETLAVVVYMGGGPSLMYAAEASRAWEEFSAS